MKDSIEIIYSDTTIAFFITLFIFCLATYMAIKQWIKISFAFLLLILAILVGIGFQNLNLLKSYMNDYQTEKLAKEEESNASLFKKQVAQAVQKVQNEVKSEKENLNFLRNQIEEMIDQMDKQKQKLQQFVEEVQEKFSLDSGDDSSLTSDNDPAQ